MAASKTLEKQIAEAEGTEPETPDDDDDSTTADPADDDEDAADDEEATPEPEAVAEPLSMEARADAIETLTQLHFDSLEMIFGEDWQKATNCPLCSGLGAVFADDPVLDSSTQRCNRCRGYGVLITESVVLEHVNRQCPDCNGNGYVARMEPTSEPLPAQPVVVPPMPVYNVATNQWETPNANTSAGYFPPMPGVATSP